MKKIILSYIYGSPTNSNIISSLMVLSEIERNAISLQCIFRAVKPEHAFNLCWESEKLLLGLSCHLSFILMTHYELLLIFIVP